MYLISRLMQYNGYFLLLLVHELYQGNKVLSDT